MSATQIVAWMAVVQGLMAVAPDVIAFGGKVKQWVDDLFSQRLISAAQQDALHARVTEICRAALLNQTPSHWQVEADPE
jgi:hypothetical protein